MEKPLANKLKLFFILLAIPTALMATTYFFLAAVLITTLASSADYIRLFAPVLWFEIYLTLTLAAVYIAWALLSKQLSGREKTLWIIGIIFLNTLGMPWFLYHMWRRHTGKATLSGKSDQEFVSHYLAKRGLSLDGLRPDQEQAVLEYFQHRQILRRWFIPVIGLAALAIYISFSIFSPQVILICAKTLPQQVTTYQHNGNKTVHVPEQEEIESAVELAMIMGLQAYFPAILGLWGAIAVGIQIFHLSPGEKALEALLQRPRNAPLP